MASYSFFIGPGMVHKEGNHISNFFISGIVLSSSVLSADKVSPPQRNVECVWTIPNGNGFLTHIIETCFLELMREMNSCYLVREPSDAKGNRCDATRRRANFYCQGCSNRFQRRAACSSWCVDVSDKVRKINLIFCKITCESQKNV